MNSKGRDNKPHIGIFGRRNNGKSSLINALTGQETAIVSDLAGTTTDPVKKSIEIPGVGPVVMIDTAGIDDTGDLGRKRIEKSLDVLKIIDFAILVVAHNQFGEPEKNLISEFRKLDLPFIVVHNKSDEEELAPPTAEAIRENTGSSALGVSARHTDTMQPLVERIRTGMPENAYLKQTLIGDLISYGDVVLLITPIDIEAPEGRMILPQVQVIRDVLDHDGIAVVCKEREVDAFFKKMNPKPALVVTDSQVFPKADAAIPKNTLLTSFSILLARQKGDFVHYAQGTPHISKLREGDRILILESCTHHVSCDDIGRVKIPRWIAGFTGKNLEFEVVAGLNRIPRPITDYAMVIQCGGCMITRRQILNRLKPAIDEGIPVSNYGMTIAYVHGIYNRAMEPFGIKNKEDYL